MKGPQLRFECHGKMNGHLINEQALFYELAPALISNWASDHDSLLLGL